MNIQHAFELTLLLMVPFYGKKRHLLLKGFAAAGTVLKKSKGNRHTDKANFLHSGDRVFEGYFESE